MTPGQLSHSHKITLVPSHGSTFVYMIPPQNDMPPRVTPVVVPGQEIHSSTKSRNVSCKCETNTRFGVESVSRQTGTGSACVMFAILNGTRVFYQHEVLTSNNEI